MNFYPSTAAGCDGSLLERSAEQTIYPKTSLEQKHEIRIVLKQHAERTTRRSNSADALDTGGGKIQGRQTIIAAVRGAHKTIAEKRCMALSRAVSVPVKWAIVREWSPREADFLSSICRNDYSRSES